MGRNELMEGSAASRIFSEDQALEWRVLKSGGPHSAEEIRLDERQRFSRELHDGVNQVLAGISMQLEAIADRSSQISPAELERQLAQVRGMVNTSIEEIRLLSKGDDAACFKGRSFQDALVCLSEQLGEGGYEVELNLPEDIDRIDLSHATTFYRITQEFLHNTIRHAGAKKVAVAVIRQDHQLQLTLSDNGRGFDRLSTKFTAGAGLQNMQWRALTANGTFTLRSIPGQGTTCKVMLPCE